MRSQIELFSRQQQIQSARAHTRPLYRMQAFDGVTHIESDWIQGTVIQMTSSANSPVGVLVQK